jgi:hypothetical protein
LCSTGSTGNKKNQKKEEENAALLEAMELYMASD